MTRILAQSDCFHLPLNNCSVHCVVTSPPYWGLRKYSGEQGAEMWRRLKRQETDRELLLKAVLELRKCYTLGDFRRWRSFYHVSS